MIKLIIIVTLLYNSFALAENNCAGLFESTNNIQNKIDSTVKNLAELKINLDIAKAQGLNSIELTALSNNFKSKSIEFYKFVRKNNLMTKDQYIDRIKFEIAKIQGLQYEEKKENEKIKKEEDRTRQDQEQGLQEFTDGTRAIMYRVGSFDMMATPTTQMIWEKIANLANQKLNGKYRIIVNPSRHEGMTNPVESVSHHQIVEWLEALNELSQAGEPKLIDIIPSHKKGDHYRLPTKDEWNYVAFTASKSAPNYQDYIWFKENSFGTIHPVAKKLPLKFNDKNFYDLYGSVFEHTSTELKDPGLTTNEKQYFIVGGGWNTPKDSILSAHTTEAQSSSGNAGFRFVRDLGAKP